MNVDLGLVWSGVDKPRVNWTTRHLLAILLVASGFVSLAISIGCSGADESTSVPATTVMSEVTPTDAPPVDTATITLEATAVPVALFTSTATAISSPEPTLVATTTP